MKRSSVVVSVQTVPSRVPDSAVAPRLPFSTQSPQPGPFGESFHQVRVCMQHEQYRSLGLCGWSVIMRWNTGYSSHSLPIVLETFRSRKKVNVDAIGRQGTDRGTPLRRGSPHPPLHLLTASLAVVDPSKQTCHPSRSRG